ncbi:MAG: N-acetylmuramoyl-L-alanine amidase [Planctomycetota bacterium JB042]
MSHRSSAVARSRRPAGRGRAPSGLLALLLAATAPFFPGCATTGADAAAEARSDLRRADELRRVGDWHGAIAAYDAFLGQPECAPPVETVRAYLGRADAHVRRGAPSAARIDAAIALASLDVGGLTEVERREFEREAETTLGDAELSAGRAAVARPHYRRALELSPSALERDLLTYRLVLCAREDGAGSANELLARLADRGRPEFRELDRRFGAAPPSVDDAFTPPPPPPEIPRGPTVVDARARATWRAAPARGNKDGMTRIGRITVHHSGATVTATDESAAASAIRSIQRDHQDSRGWADIGYHYLIDRAGRIWEGRELKWQGAHAGSPTLNRGNVGICLLGDYRTQEVTPSQRTALFEALDALRREYGIPRARVEGHREVKGGTLCPGKKLELVIEEYRRGVAPLARG